MKGTCAKHSPWGSDDCQCSLDANMETLNEYKKLLNLYDDTTRRITYANHFGVIPENATPADRAYYGI